MTASPGAMEWVASAERDRDAVYILIQSSKPPYEIIAYHCQQSAEKYLKALFVQHDRKPPFVHDLLTLNREVQELYPSLKDVEVECERLTPFGTVTRYPGSIMDPSAEHMPQVTEWTESIRRAVRTGLELSPE